MGRLTYNGYYEWNVTIMDFHQSPMLHESLYCVKESYDLNLSLKDENRDLSYL